MHNQAPPRVYAQSGGWIPSQLARVVAAARSEKPLLCAGLLIAAAIFSSGGVDAERLDRRSHQSLILLLLSDNYNN